LSRLKSLFGPVINDTYEVWAQGKKGQAKNANARTLEAVLETLVVKNTCFL
jgi:hypothetical protein